MSSATSRPGRSRGGSLWLASGVERLLHRSRPHRPRRLDARERRVEAAAAVSLVAVATTMPLAFQSSRPFSPDLAIVLVAGHALAARIRLFLGAGYAMPTQLVLMPMLFLLPAASVPALVACGLLAAASPDVLTGRAHGERLLTAVADAWHAVGPATVIVLAAEPAPALAVWPVVAAALLAQCATDLLSATTREWMGRGIPPALQLRVIALVYLIDTCLTPLGVLIAAAAAGAHVLLLIVLFPLLVLLAAFASDRRSRIEEATRRLDELREERRRLDTAIRRIGDAFASKLDRGALVDLALRTAVDALSAQRGRATRPASRIRSDDGDALDQALAAAEVAARRTARLAAAGQGPAAAMAQPLEESDCPPPLREVVAVGRVGPPFSADEQALFGYLVQQAGAAIENVVLHDRLERQATVDELTRLANHRRFQELLAQELERGRRARRSLALVMLDVDDFKAINDTHGHQQGDLVLRRVADVLRRSCRASDHLARYGGEELAVILPDSDGDSAYAATEKMRLAIDALRVPLADGGALHVTVSAGVALATPHLDNEDGDTLIAAADAALYEAKRTGKNRTVRASRARRGLTAAGSGSASAARAGTSPRFRNAADPGRSPTDQAR